uniref:NADH dehydrogenase subunit 4L n=1 Tax=Marsupiomonas sp. NIES 1824 TaxID=1562198 RepID=A0A6H0QZW2_9CHLO|nr:NADH dehydrogenase subunit 4L [Marsupiomonas sp. NIES 1824]
MARYGTALSLFLFVLAVGRMRTNRQSVLFWFFAIELMLLAVNLLFLTLSVRRDSLEGQIVAIFVLTVAAAESRIGLSLLVMYFRTRETISLSFFDTLKE